MMVDLLAGHTSMTVRQVTDGMKLARDHLYVIPPGTYLSVGDGALHLSRPQARHGARLPFDFLLHCFSSGRGLAEAALEMGGYMSFSGILTFPKSIENRDIARDVPADRLLVETDSPYLAPVPFRGKRNEPAHVAKTAAVLAEVRGLEPAALADLTTANFRRLFRRAA